MTLDEAIARFEMGIKQIEKELFIRSEYGNQTNDMFCRIIAERYEKHRKNQLEETKQLVEMLRELKIFKERENSMTNKALASKPCEDAISRQAVLDINESHHGQMPKHINHQIWQEIKDLPSVNPQPKTGHWIQTQEKDDAEPCILWECSCCHKEFRSVVHKISNYCPNCGCRMVEPQESEVSE